MNDLDALKGDDIQQFIIDHEGDDEKELVLKKKSFKNVPMRLIAGQIAARRKAKTKLPRFYATRGIIYPPSINLEQSSSEATALFKAGLYKGHRMLDITGGLGVDSLHFSARFDKVEFIEPNVELLSIANRNHNLFGRSNLQYHHTKAENYINEAKDSFDLIYADPSRRKAGSKVVTLEDSEPNIISLLPTIFTITNHFLIKASTLLDIQSAIKALKHVDKVYVVSVENECKELLFHCQPKAQRNIEIIATDLDAAGRVNSLFEFTHQEEHDAPVSYSSPLTYLYEPLAAILKAGAFRLIANRFGLKKIAVNTHLYTSLHLNQDFPGRIFEIYQEVKSRSAALDKLLVNRKANVTTRNYPLTPEQLKKKLKVTDGGEKYVIAFAGEKQKHIVVANRIK